MVPKVLWGNMKTIKEATGKSPFKLYFGSEVVIPAEVALPTFHIHHHKEEENDNLLRHQLDFMPEISLYA